MEVLQLPLWYYQVHYQQSSKPLCSRTSSQDLVSKTFTFLLTAFIFHTIYSGLLFYCTYPFLPRSLPSSSILTKIHPQIPKAVKLFHYSPDLDTHSCFFHIYPKLSPPAYHPLQALVTISKLITALFHSSNKRPHSWFLPFTLIHKLIKQPRQHHTPASIPLHTLNLALLFSKLHYPSNHIIPSIHLQHLPHCASIH